MFRNGRGLLYSTVIKACWWKSTVLRLSFWRFSYQFTLLQIYNLSFLWSWLLIYSKASDARNRDTAFLFLSKSVTLLFIFHWGVDETFVEATTVGGHPWRHCNEIRFCPTNDFIVILTKKWVSFKSFPSFVTWKLLVVN